MVIVLFHADGRPDKRSWWIYVVAFRNFANPPRNFQQFYNCVSCSVCWKLKIIRSVFIDVFSCEISTSHTKATNWAATERTCLGGEQGATDSWRYKNTQRCFSALISHLNLKRLRVRLTYYDLTQPISRAHVLIPGNLSVLSSGTVIL
jgi:hypothetical protein